MRLILVRHGKPHRTDVTHDPDLTPEGQAQAEAVGRRLRAEGVDHVVSSPKQRALQTAGPLGGENIEVIDELAEWERHDNAYVPRDEVMAEGGDAWLEFNDGIEEYFAGAFGDFKTGVATALDGLIERNPGRNVAVFCHGGVINVYLCHLLSSAASTFLFDIDYTGVTTVLASRSGVRTVMHVNDIAHLR